ncbi:hypothetical protein Tco_0557445 [Tanacetum coccineum]
MLTMIRCRLLVGFCERRMFVVDEVILWTPFEEGENSRCFGFYNEGCINGLHGKENLEDDAGEILECHSQGLIVVRVRSVERALALDGAIGGFSLF